MRERMEIIAEWQREWEAASTRAARISSARSAVVAAAREWQIAWDRRDMGAERFEREAAFFAASEALDRAVTALAEAEAASKGDGA